MWGGEFIYLIFLGCGAIVVGIVGGSLVMVTSQVNPKRRLRGVLTLGVGLLGYVIGGLFYLHWWTSTRLPDFAWPLIGLFLGGLLGNIAGRVAWVWMKPDREEIAP